MDERLLVWLLGAALLAGALWLVRGVLVPLLFVGVFTFLGAPLVERLERRRIPRSVGAGVFLLLLVVLLSALLASVLPSLVADLLVFVQRLPALLGRLTQWVELRTGYAMPSSLQELSGEAAQELLAQLMPFAQKGGALVGRGAASVMQGAASTAGVLGKALVIPIITYFMLTELPAAKVLVRDLLPLRFLPMARYYAPLLNDALAGLVRGQLIVAAVMAIIYVVGLSLSGVPMPLAIGILAGAAYVIPFATGAVAVGLSAAFSLFELGAGATGPVIGAIFTAVVVQVLESYLLTPRIVGEKAGLSPLAAMLAVLLGGTAAGFMGVVFALPVAAVVALVLREEAARHARSLGTNP